MNPTEDREGMRSDEALAMDFALGALSRNERRAAKLRLQSDHGFRALVDDWSARLAPLDDETSFATPPAEIWPAIAAEIAPAPRQVAVPAAALLTRHSIWQSLMLWRAVSFAGVAAAIIAIMQIGPPAAPPIPTEAPELLVAALAGADGKPLLSAVFDPWRGAIVLTPATQRQDKDKSAELWVIEGKNPPRSLGVIDVKGPDKHVVTSDQLKGLESGATLAISIEPYGGSRTGRPTGPVVATGTLRAV